MKIKDVEVYILPNPWKKWVFLKTITDSGEIGYGEATVFNGQFSVKARIDDMRRFFIDADPFKIEKLTYNWMQGSFNRNRDLTNISLMSGIEASCWDIIGKHYGAPVYELIGGMFADRIKAYANGWYTSINKIEDWGKCAKKVVNKGYKALKFDPFGSGAGFLSIEEWEKSKKIIESVYDAVGDNVEMLIEGHGRFNRAMALKIAKYLESYDNIGWFEEPLIPEDIDGLAQLAKTVKVPIAAGERYITRYDFVRPFEIGALHIAQPDVINTGGILETKKIAAMAETYNIAMAPHQAEGPINTFITLQLDATLSNLKIQEMFDEFAYPDWAWKVVSERPEVKDGYVIVPKKPGIGIEITDKVSEHLATSDDVDFSLFSEGWEKRGFKHS